MRLVKHWHRLPREAGAAPSLAVFKAMLDGALSNLVWWKVSLPIAGGLEPDDLQGPFQPKPFCDSMTQSLSFYFQATKGFFFGNGPQSIPTTCAKLLTALTHSSDPRSPGERTTAAGPATAASPHQRRC